MNAIYLVPFLQLLNSLLGVVWIVIIASVIMSWLVAFNVINLHNSFVSSVYYTVVGITEPMFRPIRNMLPSMGGIDISPIIVLLLLTFLQNFISTMIFRLQQTGSL